MADDKRKATFYMSRDTEVAFKKLQADAIEAGEPAPTLTELVDKALREEIERRRKALKSRKAPM